MIVVNCCLIVIEKSTDNMVRARLLATGRQSRHSSPLYFCCLLSLSARLAAD